MGEKPVQDEWRRWLNSLNSLLMKGARLYEESEGKRLDAPAAATRRMYRDTFRTNFLRRSG